MKTFVRILGLFLLVFTLSCDDLTEQTISDVEISETVFIDVFENTKKTYPWNEAVFISLANNPDLEDVLDDIKQIETKSVNILIQDITSDVLNDITVSFIGLNLTYTLAQPAVNQDISLDIPTADLNRIAEKLENDWYLDIILNGNTDQAPVSFRVTITTIADVTVDII